MSVNTAAEQIKIKSKIIKARRLRKENQSMFWRRLGVTQSGGSRYERLDADKLRDIPKSVALLFDLVYGPRPLAKLSKLRGTTIAQLIAGE